MCGKNEALWNSWEEGTHRTALPLPPFHFLIRVTKLLLWDGKTPPNPKHTDGFIPFCNSQQEPNLAIYQRCTVLTNMLKLP